MVERLKIALLSFKAASNVPRHLLIAFIAYCTSFQFKSNN